MTVHLFSEMRKQKSQKNLETFCTRNSGMSKGLLASGGTQTEPESIQLLHVDLTWVLMVDMVAVVIEVNGFSLRDHVVQGGVRNFLAFHRATRSYRDETSRFCSRHKFRLALRFRGLNFLTEAPNQLSVLDLRHTSSRYTRLLKTARNGE